MWEPLNTFLSVRGRPENLLCLPRVAVDDFSLLRGTGGRNSYTQRHQDPPRISHDDQIQVQTDIWYGNPQLRNKHTNEQRRITCLTAQQGYFYAPGHKELVKKSPPHHTLNTNDDKPNNFFFLHKMTCTRAQSTLRKNQLIPASERISTSRTKDNHLIETIK